MVSWIQGKLPEAVLLPLSAVPAAGRVREAKHWEQHSSSCLHSLQRFFMLNFLHCSIERKAPYVPVFLKILISAIIHSLEHFSLALISMTVSFRGSPCLCMGRN